MSLPGPYVLADVTMINPGLTGKLCTAHRVSEPSDPSSHVAACVRSGLRGPPPAQPSLCTLIGGLPWSWWEKF